MAHAYTVSLINRKLQKMCAFRAYMRKKFFSSSRYRARMGKNLFGFSPMQPESNIYVGVAKGF